MGAASRQRSNSSSSVSPSARNILIAGSKDARTRRTRNALDARSVTVAPAAANDDSIPGNQRTTSAAPSSRVFGTGDAFDGSKLMVTSVLTSAVDERELLTIAVMIDLVIAGAESDSRSMVYSRWLTPPVGDDSTVKTIELIIGR